MERGVVYLEHIENSRKLLFWAAAKRLYFRNWHRISKKRYSARDFFYQAVVWLLWFTPVLMNVAIKISLKEKIGSALLGLYIIANAVKAWRDHSPTAWLLAREDFATRQLFFGGVVKSLIPMNMEEGTIHALRVDCLYLIAECARAWRWDISAKQIFANLLVVDEGGTTVTVVARDREKPLGTARPVPKSYAIENRQAVRRTVETGRICEVGDLKVELPGGPPEDYRNVIVLPLRKTPLGPVVAVVSIDSSVRYHFSGEAKHLETHLQPYLSALECTL